MARPSIQERAQAFVAKARPSIAGQGGHDAVFAVACALVVGFALGDDSAWELLQQYNCASCSPAWSEKDLRRKLAQARRQAERHPGDVGKLADQDAPNYTGPRLPANKPPLPMRGGAPPAAAPGSGVRSPNSQRTPRTAFFNVRENGGGAKPAHARTLRTPFYYSSPYEEKIHCMEGDRKVASELSKPSERTDRTPPAEPAGGSVVKTSADLKPTQPKPSETSDQSKRKSAAGLPRHYGPMDPKDGPVDITTIWSDGQTYKTDWRGKHSDLGNIYSSRA